MNKMQIISAALLLPAAIIADVNVSVSVGGSHGCDHDQYIDEVYSDDGEPWFEECESSGPSRVSLEYQWTLHGQRHVLRYRRVTFHTLSTSWVFGPWMVKVNYCHPSCNYRHKHVYYHYHSHPNWGRVYNSTTRVYYYEYRSPRHHHRQHAKVYRHEYRPQYVEKRTYKPEYDHEGDSREHRNNSEKYHHKRYSESNKNKPDYYYKNDDYKYRENSEKYHNKQDQKLPKRSNVTVTEKVKKTPHKAKVDYRREPQKKTGKKSEDKIIRISGRDRL